MCPVIVTWPKYVLLATVRLPLKHAFAVTFRFPIVAIPDADKLLNESPLLGIEGL
jgi:hypothetical protein